MDTIAIVVTANIAIAIAVYYHYSDTIGTISQPYIIYIHKIILLTLVSFGETGDPRHIILKSSY